MKCEKCGAEINRIMVDSFIYDGSDIESAECFSEMDENAVVIDVDADWTGYDLTEEEQRRTITCPCCKEFPFKNKEIQVYEIIRIVCFKKGAET